MILCCGEALVDMIPTPGVDGVVGYVPHPGGAVFNTAVALGRLGGTVALLSGVSSDPFGEQLKGSLQDAGVRTDLLIRSNRLTTLAMVHLQDGSATYSFYDENSAGRMIRTDDAPDLPADISTLFFGGISLVNEPAAESYAALLANWRTGRTVMIDPNIRPGFITDETRYRARLDRMIGMSDILKMSEDDLEWFDDRQSPEATARAMLDRGPRIVVLTRAENGAMALTKEHEVHVPAVAVQMVDTVGAGDTFDAGFLFQLDRIGALGRLAQRLPERSELAAALEFAALAAALCCTRVGANPPTIDDVAAFGDHLPSGLARQN